MHPDHIKALVDSPFEWYSRLYHHPLYPDQLEFCEQVEKIVYMSLRLELPGPPITYVAARQSGKNEASSRLEVRQMVLYSNMPRDYNMIKAAPSFKPQLITSRERLRQSLKNPLTRGKYRPFEGYKFMLGSCTTTFLSADKQANQRSETASLLLEMDEAQDTDIGQYNAVFAPMKATTNAPAVFYGTRWGNNNLLEEMAERSKHYERKLGLKLFFETPWWVRAQHNPAYARSVQEEIDRLGENHPVILTQYCCRAVQDLLKFFSLEDLKALQGQHQRLESPRGNEIYVAGVDLCGCDESDPRQMMELGYIPGRDAVVATVASLKWKMMGSTRHPSLNIVDHLFIPGHHPWSMERKLFDFLFGTWKVQRAVVDAGGVGNAVAKALASRRPGQVVALAANTQDMTRMGYALLGAVKTGRLRMYRRPDDGVAWEEFWRQASHLQAELLPGGRMRWQSGTADVHDDFMKSLGMLVEAAEDHIYRQHEPYVPETTSYEFGAGYA